jgi:hypothetical protein
VKTSLFWQTLAAKAETWPSFHDTPKLKDKLHGDDLDHYSIPYLKNLCRERNLGVGGRKPELVARLERYKCDVEENPDFQEQLQESFDKLGDTSNDFIRFERENIGEESAETGPREAEVEDTAEEDAGLSRQIFEVEKFVKYSEDSDEMLVKWKGYSAKHNSFEPCKMLEIDLGKNLFRELARPVQDLYKGTAPKARKKC